MLCSGRCTRSIHAEVVKAAVLPGQVSGTRGSDLATPTPLASGFLEYLRPLSVVGQLEALFRSVPANVKIPRQTSTSTVSWVGESHPIPATSIAFDTVQLEPPKVAAISVITRELARLSEPSATALLRNDLAASLAFALDQSFLDPASAGSAGISPPSVTYGATSFTSGGLTNAESDIGSLVDSITTPTDPVLVMHSRTARSLARLRTADTDIPVFPDMGPAAAQFGA